MIYSRFKMGALGRSAQFTCLLVSLIYLFAFTPRCPSMMHIFWATQTTPSLRYVICLHRNDHSIVCAITRQNPTTSSGQINRGFAVRKRECDQMDNTINIDGGGGRQMVHKGAQPAEWLCGTQFSLSNLIWCSISGANTSRPSSEWSTMDAFRAIKMMVRKRHPGTTNTTKQPCLGLRIDCLLLDRCESGCCWSCRKCGVALSYINLITWLNVENLIVGSAQSIRCMWFCLAIR